MKVFTDFDITTFEAWSGAKDTKETIINEGKTQEFNQLMEDLYSDGASETTINDILWHETSWVYEILGIKED